jgi:hypothetical protein
MRDGRTALRLSLWRTTHAIDPAPQRPRAVCHSWASEVPPSIYLAFMYTSYGLIARKILAGMPYLDNTVREVYSTGHS